MWSEIAFQLVLHLAFFLTPGNSQMCLEIMPSYSSSPGRQISRAFIAMLSCWWLPASVQDALLVLETYKHQPLLGSREFFCSNIIAGFQRCGQQGVVVEFAHPLRKDIASFSSKSSTQSWFILLIKIKRLYALMASFLDALRRVEPHMNDIQLSFWVYQEMRDGRCVL